MKESEITTIREKQKERQSKEKIIPLEIYTDGSCHKFENRGKGIGAWAFIAVEGVNSIYATTSQVGDNTDTTNQRMELLAAAEACAWAEITRSRNQKVIIYSDSAYLINAFNQNWIGGWKARGWVNSQNKEVANKDLWFRLLPYYDNIHYSFVKVKGHDKSVWNIKADELANKVVEDTINSPRR